MIKSITNSIDINTQLNCQSFTVDSVQRQQIFTTSKTIKAVKKLLSFFFNKNTQVYAIYENNG